MKKTVFKTELDLKFVPSLLIMVRLIVACVILSPLIADAQGPYHRLSISDNSIGNVNRDDIFTEEYDEIIKDALDKIENANKEREGKMMIVEDKFVDEKDVVILKGKKEIPIVNAVFPDVDKGKEDLVIDRDRKEKRIEDRLNSPEKIEDSVNTKINIEETIVPIIDILDVDSMDIKDVMRIISVKSGLTIITDPEVVGTVTIFLSNIDAKDALRIVLEANGLAFYEEDGVVYVMTANRFELEQGFSFTDSVRSEMVRLKYSKVNDMLELLSQMKGPMGRVFANEETNTVVMVDDPEKVVAMMSFIEKVDVALETKEFQLKNKISEEIMANIEKALTKNVGKINYNGELNVITVKDTPSRIEQIGKLIEQLDYENRDISYDIKIIQIVLNDEHMDGVDWEAIVSGYQSLDFIRTNGNEAVEQTLSIGTVIDEDFVVLQEALDTVGEIYTLRNDKRLKAVDRELEFELNLSGVIDSIDEDLDTDKKEKASNSAEAMADQEKIKIYLMSQIKMDKGRDSLDVEIYPEVDFSDISPDDINVDSLGPKKKEMFLKRMIKTPFEKVFSFGRAISPFGRSKKECIEVKDCEEDDQEHAIVDCLSGSTIVVGSLFKTVSFESQKRIPFLGALPMVGSAFTRQGVRSSKSEVIIFITPKVSFKGE